MTSGSPIWDAVVVGSGPAGATAALHLAQRDFRVLILEKETWPRYKTCGGGLVWRARRQLDVDVGDSLEGETHLAELHVHDTGTAFAVTRVEPLVSMTLRSVLDDTLTKAALAAGAEMESARKVTHLDQLPDSVTLVAGDHSYRTRFVIAADGAAGATATLSAWGQHPHLIPALESEIRTDAATLKRFSGVARFDFGLVSSGYAWVFPKRNHLSVGCLSFRRHKHELQRNLAAYLRLLDIDPLQSEDHGFVIPVAPRASPLTKGRVLLTGDSAGLVDPVTCEGISNAILSGRLAAGAIAEGGPSPGGVSRTYQRSLEDSILRELRFGRILAGFLYRSPRLSRFAFRRLGQSLSEAMADIISGDRTYQELLSSPKGYFHVLGRLLGLRGTYPKG